MLKLTKDRLRPALFLMILPGLAAAAEAVAPAEPLDTITVSATRLRSVPDFDVPASITTIGLNPDNSRADISVTESMAGIPGLTALDRQNYAQDTQLSIRGFGARSTFGVRGVRLFSDGIPASMPDGQGQLSHFNAMGGERIEVMRGPFSALYGNSSGGVVQVWSKDGAEGDPWRAKATYGSNDAYTLAGQALGREGPVGYNVALSRFDTDGYRDHSAARRDSANARATINFDESQRLNVLLNYVDIDAQDPLGLTRAQWNAAPRSVASVADDFNTRKTVQQFQGGLVYELLFGGNQSVRLMGYAGNRQVVQFLAIPVATQANAMHSGGVVDLDSDYDGADARWSWNGELAGRPLEITVGANFDEQNQDRRGYNDYVTVGSVTTLGVQGLIRRDESNRVQNLDQFAQVFWEFAPRWSVLAGVRHTEVEFHSSDHYIRTGNPDDSGSVTHTNTTPVGGLMWSATDALRFYFSTGKGFETPTFNELSYRADGQAGLAFNLRPAVSHNYELGSKWKGEGGLNAAVALFRADTNDELAVARNVGGSQQLPERRAGAPPGRRGLVRPAARTAARPGLRVHVHRRDVPVVLPHLHRPALHDAERHRPGRRADPGRGASPGIHAPELARGRMERRARAHGRERPRRQRPGERTRPGLCARARRSRSQLHAARRPPARLRAHREPARSRLHRLGDRQRSERPLLRDGARTQLPRRRPVLLLTREAQSSTRVPQRSVSEAVPVGWTTGGTSTVALPLRSSVTGNTTR